ncbi:uncharacterized protein TrAtP1_011437 [Trichoderma atroviride]|uniref:uncharacterized protein n=1 Tax=Hypocrea atroviridis TaxID=63577 RepID=UPI003321950C|nr:hypothetical protein TrAtP1_011437 [Trichoderma atroviride]
MRSGEIQRLTCVTHCASRPFSIIVASTPIIASNSRSSRRQPALRSSVNSSSSPLLFQFFTAL